jgi:16S rRNA processing protein RimM
MTDQRVLLGEIISVHGIKGEVIVRCHTADPESISAYGALQDEGGRRAFTVTAVRTGPKGVIARIDGIQDRTAAEALRGTRLYVERAKLPMPDDGSYYVTDLVGLSAHDASGGRIGEVTAVHNFGAGDILELSVDGRTATELLPFTDAFVPAVDLTAGTVTVVLADGNEDGEDDDDHDGPPADAGDKKKDG